jgi:hypothetical protein
MQQPKADTKTASFITPAGLRSVQFIFSSDFTGNIGSAPFNGATDYEKTFEADAGQTLDSISVTITTGSLRFCTT